MSEDKKTPNEELDDIVSQGEDDLKKYSAGEGDIPLTDSDTSLSDDSKDTTDSKKDDGGEPAPESEPEDTPPTPEDGNIEIGVSRAYGGIPDTDIYGKHVEPKKSKSPVKKPEKPKTGSVADAKNIMELFWKEFILKSYGWCVDFCVDSVINLAEFVFYPDDDGVEESKKLNIFALGQKMRDKTKEQLKKKKNVCMKGYSEFLNNLEKDKRGRAVTWGLLGSEPRFFREISSIYKKRESERTDEENQLIYMVKNPPLEQMITDGINMHDMSMAAATCKVAADRESGYMISQSFTENMERLKLFIKSNNSTNVVDVANLMLEELEPYGEVVEPIKQSLSAIKEAVLSNKTNTALDEHKNITKALEPLKDNPAFWESRILVAERGYFSKIEKNIEEIYSSNEHTVSESFTKQLMTLNRIASSGELTSTATKDASLAHLTTMISSLDESNPVQNALKQELNNMLTLVQTDTTGTISVNMTESLEKINGTHLENSPQTKKRQEFFESLASSIRSSKKAYDECSGIMGSIMHAKRLGALRETVKAMDETFSVTPSTRTSTGINPFDVYNTILNSVNR